MWPGHVFMRLPYTWPSALTESDSVSTFSHHLLVTETDTKHLCSPAIILPTHAQKHSQHREPFIPRRWSTAATEPMWPTVLMGYRRGREMIGPKCDTSPYLSLQCSSLQTTKTTEIKWKADWCCWLKEWVWCGVRVMDEGWKNRGKAAARENVTI